MITITTHDKKFFELEIMPMICYDYLASKWLPVTLKFKKYLTNNEIEILKAVKEFQVVNNNDARFINVNSFKNKTKSTISYNINYATVLDN
jgi:hypothetical protein